MENAILCRKKNCSLLDFVKINKYYTSFKYLHFFLLLHQECQTRLPSRAKLNTVIKPAGHIIKKNKLNK